MSGDFTDPAHAPGILGAIGAIVLGYFKLKEKNDLGELRTQHETRLNQQESRIATLATREELKQDLYNSQNLVLGEIRSLRSDVMTLIRNK